MPGMFCEVSIKGKIMDTVAILPLAAISEDKSVFIANNNKLEKTQIDIIHIEDQSAFISHGISHGDLVVVSPTNITNDQLNIIVVE